MPTLTKKQRKALADVASGEVTWCQESPTNDVSDYRMLYETGLITGAYAGDEDGFALLEMRVIPVEDARPQWKRWTFWRSLIAGGGASVLFVMSVLTFWKSFA